MISWYLGGMCFSKYVKSLWKFFFLILQSSFPTRFTNTWRLWSGEEIHCWQREKLHCSQNLSHIIKKCFWHLVIHPWNLNCTTLCSVDSSVQCFSSHSTHKYFLHKSLCNGSRKYSRRWQRITSWRLYSGFTLNHLLQYEWDLSFQFVIINTTE